MKSTSIVAFAIVLLAGCGSAETVVGDGGVDTSGGGGVSGSGGKAGSGGAAGAGGKLGSGGAAGSGGKTGSGGAAGAGGKVGSGGAPGSGGKVGSGGTGSGGSGSGGSTCTATTLKAAAACTGRLMGVALTTSHLGESAYTTAAREHSYVTAENEMKWDTVEGSRGSFNFGPGDQIVTFATQNGMKVKGHTLVWHSQLPSWVSGISSASDLRSVMTNHINKVMAHWKGKIHAWDVVNEAMDSTSKTGDGTASLRKSVFMNVLGSGYIDEAFTAARAADPGALLFYNDYSTEGMNAKSNAVYEMVKSMKTRGIPIDGVGIQTHIGTPNDTPTAAEIAQNLKRLADLGLQVVISEMDVNCCDGYTNEQEKVIYHDIVAACVAEPACTAITVWGITDKYSWLNTFGEAGCGGQSARALLWDNNYGKKPAYTGVMDALMGK